MLVNAHAPFKDGTVIKPLSVAIAFCVDEQKMIQNCNVWTQIF